MSQRQNILKPSIYILLYNGDIIYNKAFVVFLALVITGAIRGTSRDKIYFELGLESLQDRFWYINLCVFYEIKKRYSNY